MLAPAERDGGNVEALVGTQVEVIAETNREPRRPLELIWTGGGKVALQPTAGTHEARGTFTVRRDDSYTIRFYDPQTDQVNQGAVHYRVNALADRPPAVEISGAAASVSVPADGSLGLGVRARDDYGLERIALCWRKAGATEGGDDQTRSVRALPRDTAVLSVTEQAVSYTHLRAHET